MLFNRTMFAVAGAASSEATRPQLNGVHVAPDGTLTACDGHMMVRLAPPQMPDEADFPRDASTPADAPVIPAEGFILPADAAKAISKAIPTPKAARWLPTLQHARLESLNGKACFVTTDLDSTRRHEARPLEGPYPTVESVIPTGKPELSIGFNLELLEKFCKAARATMGNPHQSVARFDFHGPLKPCVVTMQNECGSLLGLVMPMTLPKAEAVPASR